MPTVLSGPMFEPAQHNGLKKIVTRDGGAHYSVWHLDAGANDQHDTSVGMESLRGLFPNGEADEYQFVMFSTSGVHGSYITIEEIEEGLFAHGDDFEPGEDWPENWHGKDLTVLVVHPRIVCLRCGNVRVKIADIPFLKKLRASSLAAVTASMNS